MAAFEKVEFGDCGLRTRAEQSVRALWLSLLGVLPSPLPCFQLDSNVEPEG